MHHRRFIIDQAMRKNAGFLTGLTARAADTVLSPLVRRSGLFKNYYSSLARTGFLHGLEGTQQLAPRVRPFIGALSPSLSGLTDYEMSRSIGAMAKAKGVTPGLAQAVGAGKGVPSYEAVTKLLSDNANPVGASQLGRLPEYVAGTAPKPSSPLLRHLQHGLQENPHSPTVEWMKKRFTKEAPTAAHSLTRTAMGSIGLATAATMPEIVAHTLSGSPLGAASAIIGNLPEGAMVARAYGGKPGLLGKFKAQLVRNGMNSVRQPQTMWQGVKNWGTRLLSPAMNETFQAGQDLENMAQQARRTQHVAGTLTGPAAAPHAQDALSQVVKGHKSLSDIISQHADMPWSNALKT